ARLHEERAAAKPEGAVDPADVHQRQRDLLRRGEDLIELFEVGPGERAVAVLAEELHQQFQVALGAVHYQDHGLVRHRSVYSGGSSLLARQFCLGARWWRSPSSVNWELSSCGVPVRMPRRPRSGLPTLRP